MASVAAAGASIFSAHDLLTQEEVNVTAQAAIERMSVFIVEGLQARDAHLEPTPACHLPLDAAQPASPFW